jgi:hypothetical protein
MLNGVLKKWQNSRGIAFALLALLAWCMPTFALGCTINAMPPGVSLQCREMALDVSSIASDQQQMPCCSKIPVPQTPSTSSHSGIISTDGHINVLAIAFPNSHAPLWALLIAAPKFEDVANVKSTFPLKNFSSPPSAEAASPLPGRAPPSLI